LSYLRHIPNIVVMAPKDEAELARMMVTALDHDGPCAVRYPRGTGVGAKVSDNPRRIAIGKGELVRDGADALVITIGSRVYPAIEAAMELEKSGPDAAVFNARFVKPLPEKQLLELAARFGRILIVEENALAGGFGSAVLELFNAAGVLADKRVQCLGIPDAFVEHGTQKELRALLGIDKNGIKRALRKLCK
ncbi:MAG: transketolase C-terminal domain-containing protein, partial [Pseudodesulfovibrio sp.]